MKKKRIRRKRLTEDEWLTFKMGECITNPTMYRLAANQAKRSGKQISEEFDSIARVCLTSFYLALPPKIMKGR